MPIRNRENPLESGLYFFVLDYFHKTANPEITSILSQYKLELKPSNPKLTDREAFYLNLKEKPQCHLTIDCKYYDEFAASNERLKWHYCHYTDESVQDKIIHVYFNALGTAIRYCITNKETGITTTVTREALFDIELDLECAARIVYDFIDLKNIASSKAKDLASSCATNIATIINDNFLSQDLVQLLDEKLQDYKDATNLARRYVDEFLYFPEKMLAKIVEAAKQRLATKPPANLDAVPQAVGLVNNSAAAHISSIPAGNKQPNPLEQKLNALHNEVSSIKQLSLEKLFSKLYLLDELKFEIIEIIPKLNAKAKKSAIRLLNSILELKPSESINAMLNPRTMTLDFLRVNFHLIESRISLKFYVQMINLAILSSDDGSIANYVRICDYLSQNSSAYLSIIKKANISQPGESKSFATTSLELCFTRDNHLAFEMLLRHGLNLAANSGDCAETNTNISLFKHLLAEFTVRYLEAVVAEDQARIQQTTDKIYKFLSVMFKPEFKAGFEYESTLRCRISKGALKAKFQETRRAIGFAERHSSIYKLGTRDDLIVDKVGYFSILDHGLRSN